MLKEQIVKRVWEFLEPELADQGFELVEVEYVQEGSDFFLRLYIDREGGIMIDHCVEASQLVNPLLDMENFIDGAYNLEVSSPGIDRPVRKPVDFERFAGERLKLKTVTPVGGRSRYTGKLIGIEDGLVSIECDGVTHQIHLENIRKANLDR